MNDRTDHAAEAARVVASIQRETEAAKSIEDPSRAGVALFNTNVRRELAYAQVHATLAFAEQQRLATLAYLAHEDATSLGKAAERALHDSDTFISLRIGDPA